MRSATVRLVALALLTFLSAVPLLFVYGVLAERQNRGREARAEIARAWAGEQTLAPPALALVHECRLADPPEGRTATYRWTSVVLPDRLEVRGRLISERRARGIFEALVYRAALDVAGEFPGFVPAPDADCSEVRLVDAWVAIGVGDPRGFDEVGALSLGAPPRRLEWVPGTGLDGAWARGARARIPTDLPGLEHGGLTFSMKLSLRGSEGLDLLPVGRDTAVELSGDSGSPSFRGAFLPRQRQLTAGGFSADWRVSALARSFPSTWTGATPPGDVSASAFGVGLELPADGYRRTERALKYGVLVIGLTFLSFFLFELSSGIAVHPVQYLLIDAALCLFYLLLLSLGEHFGFPLAYLVAAGAITALVACYAAAVLRGGWRAAALGALLAATYGALYALLAAEDHALLIGSAGLFALLAFLMWKTRAVDGRTPGTLDGTSKGSRDAAPGAG